MEWIMDQKIVVSVQFSLAQLFLAHKILVLLPHGQA